MNDDRDNAAASSAIFLVVFYLVCLRYFLGLLKSALVPSKIVPCLVFLADSSREVFQLIPENRVKFIAFVREILGNSKVTVKTLQCLVGKCVSFSRAVLTWSGVHTFDLMALDSNAMKDKSGNSLPHFTPGPSPGSSGVNLFAQKI